MDSWQYDDIPISKFRVQSKADAIKGEIELITNIAGKIEREIIETKAEHCRRRLIELGWTPPPEE